jgi:hypothetical protein
MTAFQEVLGQVRDRIARYSGSPINEQNTKAALIEPILRSLGWDIEDWEEVEREYKPKRVDNPVDYALLVLRTPRLFLEAKALRENLDDRRWANQIMGYAGVAGVKWVVLTNGDEYRIYNAHAAVPVADKLFRTVRITDEDSPAEETLGLLSKERMQENQMEVLWNAHFVDRQIRVAIEELFAPEPDRSLVNLIKKKVPNLSSKEIKGGLSRARLRLDFPVEPRVEDETGRRPLTPRDRREGQVSPEGDVSRSDAARKAWATRRQQQISPEGDISLGDLIRAGLMSPPLPLEATYNDRLLTARVEADGRVTFLGQSYDSLSASANAARASLIGPRRGRKPNGWLFWQFKDENGHTEHMNTLREQYLGGKSLSGGRQEEAPREDVAMMLDAVAQAAEKYGRRALAKSSGVALREASAALTGEQGPTSITLLKLYRAIPELEETHRGQSEHVRAVLQAARERCQSIGLQRFAELAGLNPGSLTNVLAGRARPGDAMLVNLEAAIAATHDPESGRA